MRVKPKLGPYLERIAAILDSDRELPRKQRHTAKRIFERLRDEGYSGGYTQVKEAVRELKRSGGEVVVPLVQEPGEAQVNFGYALVKLAGSLSKVAFFRPGAALLGRDVHRGLSPGMHGNLPGRPCARLRFPSRSPQADRLRQRPHHARTVPAETDRR